MDTTYKIIALTIYFGAMLAIGLFASWLGTLCWNEASQRLPTSLSGQLIVFETLAALAALLLWLPNFVMVNLQLPAEWSWRYVAGSGVPLGLLLVTIPFHAFFAIAVMSADTVFAGDYFRSLQRPYATDLLSDQYLGGGIGVRGLDEHVRQLRAVELVLRALKHQLTVVDDGQIRSHLLNLGQQVAGHQHGAAVVAGEADD